MIVWAHHRHPELPPEMVVRVAASATELFTVQPDEVVVWGEPPFPVALERVPRGSLLLSSASLVVQRARSLGWRALVVPEPTLAGAVVRAIRDAGSLVPVARGTLVPEHWTLWTPEGEEVLPGWERQVLALLVARAPAVVAREELEDEGMSSLDAILRRLRARIGAEHIVALRGQGWCFVPQSAPVQVPPARVVPRLGEVELDLEGRMARGREGAQPLSEREVRALSLLLEADGVVERRDLARSVGVNEAQLDLLVHRLRRKVGVELIETVRGRGYRLLREPPAQPRPMGEDPTAPLQEELRAALRERALVTLAGPVGVGKSTLAARVAGALGAHRVDLHALDPRMAARLLSRQDPARLLWVDGADDGRLFAKELRALLERAGSAARVLLTARAPTELPGEHIVWMRPWTTEALARCFPAVAPLRLEEADGLPAFVVEGPDGFGVRLSSLEPKVADALWALSLFSSWFEDEDATLVACPIDPVELVRRGLLLGRGPWRLHRPLRAAIVRTWTAERHAQRTTVARARMSRALEARPFRVDPVRFGLPDLVYAQEAARQSGQDGDLQAELAILRADAEEEVEGDASPIALSSALAQVRSPRLRGELLYRLAIAVKEERLELLEQAIATAQGETRLEWLLERAYYLFSDLREEETLACLAEAEAVLDRVAPDEWLYPRAQLAVIRANLAPEPAGHIGELASLLARIERVQWTSRTLPAGHRRTLAAQRELSLELGRLLVLAERIEDALVAFRRATDALADPDDSVGMQIRAEIATAMVHQERWEEADLLLSEVVEQAARQGRTAWEAALLARRGMYLAVRGEVDRADPLLERAGQIVEPAQAHYVDNARAWQAAARGDPFAVESYAPGFASRMTVPLGEALGHVARAIQAHRAQNPAEVASHKEALLLLFPILQQGNIGYPARLWRVLQFAGVVTRGLPEQARAEHG